MTGFSSLSSSQWMFCLSRLRFLFGLGFAPQDIGAEGNRLREKSPRHVFPLLICVSTCCFRPNAKRKPNCKLRIGTQITRQKHMIIWLKHKSQSETQTLSGNPNFLEICVSVCILCLALKRNGFPSSPSQFFSAKHRMQNESEITTKSGLQFKVCALICDLGFILFMGCLTW